MNGRHLDKIARRLARATVWLATGDTADGYRRAASVPATPGGLRDTRAAELRRLIEVDLPDLLETVREHNMRGRQGDCIHCGQPLRLVRGPRAGLYTMFTTDEGVLCQDPNCPASPDGQHRDGKEETE